MRRKYLLWKDSEEMRDNTSPALPRNVLKEPSEGSRKSSAPLANHLHTHSNSNGSLGYLNRIQEEKNGIITIEDVEEENNLPISYRQLFRYATHSDVALIVLGVLAASFSGLGRPAMVILFGRIINAFVYADFKRLHPLDHELNTTETKVVEDLEEAIDSFGIGTAIVVSAQFVSAYIFVTSLNLAAESQAFRLRCLFMKSIMRQELDWFDAHRRKGFPRKITEDLNKIQDGIGEKLTLFVFSLSTAIFSLINAFVHGWKLTLVILAAFFVLALSVAIKAKVETLLASTELKAYSKAANVAAEVFSSIQTVVSFGGENKEAERYANNLIHSKSPAVRRGIITGIGTGVTWFIIYATFSLVFWYGTNLVLDSRSPDATSDYDANDLLVIFFSVVTVAMHFSQSTPYLETFNSACVAGATVFRIIERVPTIDPTSSSGDMPKHVIGRIEFKDVQFCYSSKPKVKILRDVNLRINPGETVALIGPDGCGKSSCMGLIQRLYDPQKGTVSLDGKDIRTLCIGWLRDQIGYVDAEPVLFTTTIAENIQYGREIANFDEIQEAARQANAHDFIMKLPENYNTHVAGDGVELTEDQKRRIAIARVLLKQPKILLLDESTSGLDHKSEAIVQRTIDKIRKGKTTIIVTPRLSTIKSANLIVAMRKGKVVGTGTHEELMNKNGYYKTFVTSHMDHNGHMKAFQASIKTGRYPSRDDSIDGIIGEDLHRSSVSKSRFHSVRHENESVITGLTRNSVSSNASNEQSTSSASDIASFKEILKLNSPEWLFIVGGAIGSLIQGCLPPIYAIYFGNVFGILSRSDIDVARQEVGTYAAALLIIGIVAAFSLFLQAYMFSISGEKLTRRLRKRTIQAILRQEMEWFDDEKNSVETLCSRLYEDAAQVQQATGSHIGILVQSITTLVLSCFGGFYYSLELGAFALTFVPLVLISVYYGFKTIMNQSIAESRALENAEKIAEMAITNIRAVVKLQMEEEFNTLYSKALHEPRYNAQKRSHIRGAASGISQSIPSLSYAIVLYYGGRLIQHEEINFSDVLKIVEAMIFGTMLVVGQALAFVPNYSKAKNAATWLIALFNRKPVIDTYEDVGNKMTEELRHISFNDVSFAYYAKPTIPILMEINMKVNKEERVALFGSSDSGKTTIINLLERFYDPSTGAVCVNNINIQTVNVAYTRSLFGFVSQEPVLFDRTISENIAYGNNTRTFSQSDIEEVAKQANIHDFIISLPDGYNTRVGDKGTQLSRGQKQRIAIARALIRNPQVLLLDEVTSALDAENESMVQKALEDAQRGRTSIIFSDKASEIKDVDRIVVIDDGVIIEEGTHDQLIAAKGHYWRLYNASL